MRQPVWIGRQRNNRRDQFGRAVVFRITHLLSHRLENATDADVAHSIGQESRYQSTAIGIDGIGGARFVPCFRFEKPCAIAHFYPNHSGFLRRAKLVRISAWGQDGDIG